MSLVRTINLAPTNKELHISNVAASKVDDDNWAITLDDEISTNASQAKLPIALCSIITPLGMPVDPEV